MINLQNSKALAGLDVFTFFDNDKEWEAYAKEFPERVALAKGSPEDRFTGNGTAEVFSDAVEYAQRSLIPRPLQYWLARKLIDIMVDEGKHRVLDYGAGAGNMGMIFAMAGFKTNFVEVGGALTHFLSWRVNRHFLTSNVFAHTDNLEDYRYDLVCMQNVLEHLDDPMDVLKKLNRAMVQSAYFLITFNTSGKGLDVVTQEFYKQHIEPYLLSNFTIVPDTDGMLYRKT